MTELRRLGWEDIFLCYPIFDNICAYLDPKDILLLRQANKKLSPLFDSLFKTQWNINRQLTHFVKDPVSFRAKLAQHDALISGSFALQFFERQFWHDSDLDIYVDGSNDLRSPDPLGEYLIEREGYKLRSEKTEENNGLVTYVSRIKHISQIKTYLRKSPSKEKPIRIQIIYTTNTPLQAIIAGFHQTLVINIISWDFAYSLFPDLNFIKKISYEINGGDNTNLERGDNEDHIVKYTRRGWKCEKAAANGDTKNLQSLQLAGRRRIGDSYTWSMALDTNGVTAGQPTSVIQHSFFKIEELGRSEEPGNYIVHMKIVKSCILRYQYTNSFRYYDPSAFWTSMQEKLESMTNSQLLKFQWTEKEPLRFLQIDDSNSRYIDLASEMANQDSEGWTFYDDQISTWYVQHLKDKVKRLKAEEDKGARDQAELELHILGEVDAFISEQERIERKQGEAGDLGMVNETSELTSGINRLALT